MAAARIAPTLIRLNRIPNRDLIVAGRSSHALLSSVVKEFGSITDESPTP